MLTVAAASIPRPMSCTCAIADRHRPRPGAAWIGRYRGVVIDSAAPLDDAAIGRAVQQAKAAVAQAAEGAGRAAADVQILLATKTQTPDRIRAAVLAGIDLLGENKVQEITGKAEALQDLPHRMHLIGHLQSNKINAVLPLVQCIQTIDSAALAGKIDARLDRMLDVMVQVNVSGEESKAGVAPEQAAELVGALESLSHLRLVGLMTIGLNSPDESAVRAGYARLRELRDQLVPGGELSMGMSGDLAAAIAEGATIVRLGSAVFGARPAVT